MDVLERRYGIAGRAAGEAVLKHGRDGAKLRPASDAFLLSRIAREIVDALADDERGAVEERDALRERCDRQDDWILWARAELERLGVDPHRGQ
jgi:hypothetical protein